MDMLRHAQKRRNLLRLPSLPACGSGGVTHLAFEVAKTQGPRKRVPSLFCHTNFVFLTSLKMMVPKILADWQLSGKLTDLFQGA